MVTEMSGSSRRSEKVPGKFWNRSEKVSKGIRGSYNALESHWEDPGKVLERSWETF